VLCGLQVVPPNSGVSEIVEQKSVGDIGAKTASRRGSAIAGNPTAMTICARIFAADLLQMQQTRRQVSIGGCTPVRARRCRFDLSGGRA
jgi:hypothetical protein